MMMYYCASEQRSRLYVRTWVTMNSCSLWRLSIEGVVVDISLLFADEKCIFVSTSKPTALFQCYAAVLLVCA